MRARFAIAALLVAFGARAQSAARDELEQQLKDLVGKPPTKLLVEYEGLDQPNYKLVEIVFDLDGSSLPVPALEQLDAEGKHLIFHGDIKPGKHTLEATVVLTDISGALFSYEAGFKWKVKKSIAFDQQPGLEIQLLITPDLNPAEKDPKKKFVLNSTATPRMLAKLEDGAMPDAPKPHLPPKQGVDAGAAVVAEQTPAEKAKILKEQAAEEARLKKQATLEEARRKKEEKAAARAAAIEEAKQKRAEAAEAKKAAAEEAKQKRAQAAEAKKAAAEENKRQREEAAAAKVAAAEEKKRQREEALVAAKNPPPTAKEPVATAKPPPTEPVTEVADAGAAAVAAAEPPKPVEAAASQPPAPTEPESSGLPAPLPVLIGIALALLGIIIFVATRKKSPPQY